MREYLAEFLASLFIVYVVLATGNPLACGAALALCLILSGPISGGHINPTVTIALAAAGKIPVNKVIPYNISQILGGLVALEIFKRYQHGL